MRRVYPPVKSRKGWYIAMNAATGATKKFKTFSEMQEWYIRLTIDEMLEWSAWRYD